VARGKPVRPVQLRGGSTITQQLAKNLLLSGERTLLRKGQELVLATLLEVLLDKRRILEIYLNNVEWGEGVFGAEAAAAVLLQKARLAPERQRGRAPGRDAAEPEVLRAQAGVALPQRTGIDGRRADAGGRAALRPARSASAASTAAKPIA
jgi:hypothetical protein